MDFLGDLFTIDCFTWDFSGDFFTGELFTGDFFAGDFFAGDFFAGDFLDVCFTGDLLDFLLANFSGYLFGFLHWVSNIEFFLGGCVDRTITWCRLSLAYT